MTDYLLHKGWQVAVASPVAIGLLAAVSGGNTLAQTVSPPQTDGTLGTKVTFDNKQYQITEGTLRESSKGIKNLFHSFSVFNVPEGGSVEFSNSQTVSNIFNRVTGTEPSSILGEISAKLGAKDANIFLINPNGILFGPNASLNIGGSFVATTANSICFGKQGSECAKDAPQFRAALAQKEAPLLENGVTTPAGLVFEGESSGVILGLNSSSKPTRLLQSTGNLTLVGSTVITTKRIYAPEGQTSIATVIAPQIVPLEESVKLPQNFQPQLANDSQLAEKVSLPLVFAEAVKKLEDEEKGGLKILNGNQVQLSTSGLFLEKGDIASTAFNQTAIGGKKVVLSAVNDLKLLDGQLTPEGEDILLMARDTIQVRENGRIVLEAKENKVGNVFIKAGKDVLLDGNDSRIFFIAKGNANAGNLVIEANGQVAFSNGAYLSTQTQEGIGNAGDITINAGSVSFTQNSYVNASTIGPGNAGDIEIKTRNGSISFSDRSQILTNVLVRQEDSEEAKNQKGNGGNITLSVIDGNISFTKNAAIQSDTSANGNAGNISVTAIGRNSSITISDNATVNANTSSSGSGGTITISGQNGVAIIDTAQVNSSTSGIGNAGDIFVDATGQGSSIRVSSTPTDDKNAAINASTSGLGDAGNITLKADRLVLFSNGAEATVRTTKSTGSAGELNVFSDVIRLEDAAKLTATATFGQGGNIYLKPRNLLLMRRQSQISTLSDAGQSFDGNITVDGGFLVAVPKEDSNILAQAKNKGDIGIIDAQYIFGFTINRDSVEDTSTLIGNGRSDIAASGAVNATVLNVDPTSSLIQLPEEPRSPDLAEGCEAGSAQASASFTNIGKGGLPPSPDDPLSTELFSVEWSAIEAENKIATTQQDSSNETFSSRSYSAVPSQLTPPCQRATR